MTTRWRTQSARQLSRLVVQAGGKAQLISLGRMLVTGPAGQLIIPQPDEGILPYSHPVVALVQERTGLTFTTS